MTVKSEISIASRLKTVMENFSLSESQLARLFDVSRNSVVGWLNGKRMSKRHEDILKSIETDVFLTADMTTEERSQFYKF